MNLLDGIILSMECEPARWVWHNDYWGKGFSYKRISVNYSRQGPPDRPHPGDRLVNNTKWWTMISVTSRTPLADTDKQRLHQAVLVYLCTYHNQEDEGIQGAAYFESLIQNSLDKSIVSP